MIYPIIVFFLTWSNIRTEHFTIFYPDSGYSECAVQQASILEKYYKSITDFAHNKPGRTIVYIEDIGGMSNGFADPLVNGVHTFSYIPYPDPQFGSMPSWWRVVSLHEFTHIANMSNVQGINILFRTIFGKIFQPNAFLPTWIAESYTVYSESRQFPYEGRLNEGFFDAYAKACAKDNKFPSLPKITYNPPEFPYYSTPYIWGGLMVDFRAKKYGDRFVSDWADNIAEFLPLILPPVLELELTHQMAYSTGVGSFYRMLQIELKKEINNEQFSQYSRILYSGKEFLSFLNYDERHLYFVRHRIFKSGIYNITTFDEIVRLDLSTNKSEVIIREPMLAPFPFRVYKGKIYYAKGDFRKGGKNVSQSGIKVINDIYLYDTNTGKRKKIYSDNGTLKSFDILSDGSIVIAKQNGWRGGDIEILKNSEKIIIFSSKRIVPLDVVSGSEGIVALLHNEDEGNSISILGKGNVGIESPYAKSGLHLYGDTILFSSNRKGKWEGYIWENDKLFRITDLPFCSYPVLVNNKIYFIGLSAEGETIEETDVNFAKEIKKLEDLSMPSLPSCRDLVYTKNGYFDNFKHLLWDPVLRLGIPYYDGKYFNLLMFGFGMDASVSRALIWGFSYNTGGILTDYFFNYITTSITPFYIDLYFDKSLDIRSASLGISYPLYLSTEAGLKGIYLSSTSNYWESPDSLRIPLQFYPTIYFGNYNKSLYISLGVLYESKTLKSDAEREVYFLSENGTISYSGFSIHTSGTGFYAKRSPYPYTISPISGKGKPMKKGSRTKIELNYQLFKIRKGLWFPSIYLDGLWFRPFGEIIYSPEWTEPISTIGALISLETSAFFYLNILPSIGISYRIDEDKFYLLWSITGKINSERLGMKRKFIPFFEKDKEIFNFGNYEGQSCELQNSRKIVDE